MNEADRRALRRLAMAVTAAALTAACAGTSASPPASAPAATALTCDIERDRRAILGMAGAHRVSFVFTETVALAPGYQRKPPYEVDATELVVVVEDGPRRIVLQHILALGKGKDRRAMKHWRQDWLFEAGEVLEYRGGETWAKRAVPEAERRCAWAQQVYGIEDGPRYGSWGRWVHAGGVATWTSQPTWRPLPRREKDRKDYDVIVGINRHTTTATGWVHEQDNGKLVLRGEERLLARELGAIPYVRSQDEDMSAIERHVRENEPFWRDLRASWDAVIAARPRLTFRPTEAMPKSLNAELNDLAEKLTATPGAATASSAPSTSDRRQRIAAVIERHLAPDAQATNRADVGPLSRR